MSDRNYPILSVIISTYRQPDKLASLLHSLTQQDTHACFEVIVCDDGSPCNSLERIREADTTRLNLRYIWQPDLGFRLSRSRNNAIRCARGGILLFLDSDVIVPSDLISRHLYAHNKSKLLVLGSRSHVFADELIDATNMLESSYSALQSVSTLSSYNDQIVTIESGSSWAAILGCHFSVTRLDEVRFDESYMNWGFEDNDLACLLIYRHGYEAICPENLTVISPEHGTASRFCTIRPRTPSEIEGFILDLVYFCRKFPTVDMFFAWYCMRFFQFDFISGTWQRNEITLNDQYELSQRFQAASDWYDTRVTQGRHEPISTLGR